MRRMARPEALHCSVLTPEEQVLDTMATAVVIPAHDGLTGILLNRAPLLCELGLGILRVDTLDAGQREILVEGGFAQVLDNEVVILTEKAASGDDIFRADAEKAMAEAEAMPATGKADLEARQTALQKARLRMQIARK